LRSALGGARGFTGILALAPCRLGDLALRSAGLLDAGLLGITRRAKSASFDVDALLRLGLLGCDRVDLMADIGQPIAPG